ncbi:MAG TPA: peptidoglycan bridge formation glycyltransferase FemA/FemB family protein [Anaerolineae bacterium]|nr:peptidoglycan bridge formation glycyltransferase FemA/FemB family protein [Anaerolineae bacterium]HOR01387.1 peptidoglycan bridge formation glycyltransferase FemA/FemB family protein [Anaerolineae bacterium]HPL26956.1 peptidoglycan bridge formation glycyltransferase FemA/FemB family protein [Anaerolineae bacterium]
MRVHWPGDPDFPSPAAWDEFASAHPHGHLLQSWAWGDLKARFGWQPLRLAVSDGSGLVAGAQVLLRRLPYRSLAYVPRGPVIDPGDNEAAAALLPAMLEVARRRGAIALKVEPPWLDAPTAEAWWAGQGFARTRQTVQPRRTIIVDLRPSEEALLAQMKPKWRYNVRLASRKGVTVRQGTAADLAVFHTLMVETGARDSFGVHTPAYYEAALRFASPAGSAALFLAEHEGQVLAGLMAFAFGTQATYMYGASSNHERQRMPNHLLQWEAMRWAKARGCTSYDLWGIADLEPDSPSAALGGVERFKAGFGGSTVRYAGAFDYVYSPLVYRAFSWLWGRRRAAAQRAQPAPAEEAADS